MITTQKMTLKLKDVWTIARGSSQTKENVLVKIEKDGGTGYGEAAPNVRYGENAATTEAMIQRAAEAIRGRDLFAYTQIKEVLDEVIVGQNCAKAALDMAVMDWVAKSFRLPLYKMLGLDAAKAPVTSYSIGIDKPEILKRKIEGSG